MNTKECKEPDSFYQRIKKWIAWDYYNPGIKAEVLLDMLISGDIEDILSTALFGSSDQNMVLLAKEFPIDNGGRDITRRNRKADYLLVNDAAKQLYLVELKTTKSSFDRRQFRNYLRFCGKKVKEKPDGCIHDGIARDLFGFYQQICAEISCNDIANAYQKSDAFKIKSTGKYVFQLLRMMKKYPQEECSNSENGVTPEKYADPPEMIKTYINDILSKRLANYQVMLVYLSLEPLDLNKKIDVWKPAYPIKNEYRENLKSSTYNIVLRRQKDFAEKQPPIDMHNVRFLFNDEAGNTQAETERWHELKEIIDHIVDYHEDQT